MIPIVFMGSPQVAVPSLNALVQAAARHGATVVGVFAQPARPVGRHRAPQPCPAAAAATALGIPVFTPAKLRSPEGESALRALHPRLVVVCAYGHILSQALLDLPALGCFNLHFSLLPRWRGASPVQSAILAGDAETGVSLQRMVAALDAGPIAAESAPLPIGAADTADSLGSRLAGVSAQLLAANLPALLSGHVPLAPQDAARVTLCRTFRKEDGAIDWAQATAVEIERKVRAFTPWPGCHGFVGGRRLGLVRVAVATDQEAAPLAAQPVSAGTLLPGGLAVSRSGCVRLLEVKPEGKGAMPWADFVRGSAHVIGMRLTPQPA
jgi:methionyl-tRNA formyltransferase